MESKRIRRHIDRLLLDPNNYRFIDKSDYKQVPEDSLTDSRIQQRTFNLLVGKNNENITDLVVSFKSNGFLDIDQIQVRPVGENFIVLEGNRRVATLKYLFAEYKLGNDVGVLREEDFRSVPVVEIIGEDPVHHLISMGLHHISGKRRWSALNQAQFVADLIYKYGKTEEDVCQSLGISKQILRKNIRTLSLIEQYKESDFGDQFQTNMYSFFEEIIRNQNMKEWIEWNDDDYRAENETNVNKFFSWISSTEEVERDEYGDEHVTKHDAIITQSRQIRELSKYIFDEKALAKMEESRSISEGYSFSDAVGESKLRNALFTIKNEVQAVFLHSEYMTGSDVQEVNKLKDKLDRLIPSSQAFLLSNEKKTAAFFESILTHLTSASILNYRKLENITIENFTRINIFAGGNNLGKTSMLEAIYLLSQGNDIQSLVDLEKYRGKFLNGIHSNWMNINYTNSIEVHGVFNGHATSLSIEKVDTEDNIDKTGYLSTLVSQANIGNSFLESSIHLFQNKEPELRYVQVRKLCSAAFTSPYRYNGRLLQMAHAEAVTNGYFERVINFLRLHFSQEYIEKIDLITSEGENRFMVTSSSFSRPIDLTKYGEGLQRVFEIALLLGYCRDGILCIDEVDSALHKNLMRGFTEFLQKTAEEFNVQVFLSTHSKECIDAFVENTYKNDEITAFSMSLKNGGIVCEHVEGSRLERLVENLNIDIR